MSTKLTDLYPDGIFCDPWTGLIHTSVPKLVHDFQMFHMFGVDYDYPASTVTAAVTSLPSKTANEIVLKPTCTLTDEGRRLAQRAVVLASSNGFAALVKPYRLKYLNVTYFTDDGELSEREMRERAGKVR